MKTITNNYQNVIPNNLNYLSDSKQKSVKSVKNALWLYFWLLLFEGSLRKWVLPQLATPLLIIRDPIALWILLKWIGIDNKKTNIFNIIINIITLISVVTAVFIGHGNLFVALFGARIFILHLPLIFIIGSVFNYNDVIRIGRFLVILLIPTTLLISIQFYSPQSSFVNLGVGGDVSGAGFGAVNTGGIDFFRPPGFFSFTGGNVMYYSLTFCFVVFSWIDEVKTHIPRLWLILGSIAIVVAVPICLSRTLIFQLIITLFFTLIALYKKPKLFLNLLLTLIFSIIVLVILNYFSIFNKSVDILVSRFIDANETEGGVKGTLGDRFLGGLVSAIFIGGDSQTPFWGYGIGLGTNAGAAILTGKGDFLLAEQDWARIIQEMGFILGLIVILWRVLLSFNLFLKAYHQIGMNNLLPFLLVSFSFLLILQGQLGPPFSLGFTVIAGGLSMAALNDNTGFKNSL